MKADQEVSTVKSNLIINVKAVKALAIRKSRELKGNRFTQVSRDFVLRCDNQLRQYIENQISYLPSKGKTI